MSRLLHLANRPTFSHSTPCFNVSRNDTIDASDHFQTDNSPNPLTSHSSQFADLWSFIPKSLILSPNISYLSPPAIKKDTRIFRRDINVIKPRGQEFGLTLSVIHGRIFVIYITPEIPPGVYSAAYRSGLKFGDELITFNKNDFNSVEEKKIPDLLRELKTISLEVADSPLFIDHTIIPEGSPCFSGMVYQDQQIMFIRPDSIMDKAGFTVNSAIVSINDNSTIGMSDTEIARRIDDAIQDMKPFDVVTMHAPTTMKLVNDLKDHLNLMKIPYPPHVIIDSDFSLLAAAKAAVKSSQYKKKRYIST